MAQPVRVDALLEAGLRRLALEHVPDIPTEDRAPGQRAEQRAVAEAVLAPPVHPAGDGIDRARVKPDRPRLVALAVQDAQRAVGQVHVGRAKRQGLADPEPGPVHHGNERAVADAGRRAQQDADFGLCQRLRGKRRPLFGGACPILLIS